jgi:N-methylhydantoinase A
MVGHATTIATNTLLGQLNLELPKTAFVTTYGFKDIIEIGRQRRAEVYNLFFNRPMMLVERRLRYEINERISTEGDIITPIKDEEIDLLIKKMSMEKIESVAIGLLNSYANPIHEKILTKKISDSLPGIFVTSSHSISNEYREYERFSTAIINAVLMPLINTYLTKLEESIQFEGIEAPLYVMQSNGGMAKSNIARLKPATLVESGPAAGVIGSAWLGGQIGVHDVISFDMGGTTAKAGMVRGMVPGIVPEYEVAGHIHLGRLVKGSGYPVRFPFIDLAECSAGGGTIASSDNGTIQVGPKSAGAYPGPACYGLGGEEATITDSNLFLGRLNESSLLKGDMCLKPELARKALTKLSESVGISAKGTAISIIKIANSIMSKILRIVSVERGFDPRLFTLVAFGGAGPMHACALAEELEISTIIVPKDPGMFSALGLLTADLFHDYSIPILEDIVNTNISILKKRFQELEKIGKETLRIEGIPEEAQTFQRSLDMRYSGQGYELNINIPRPLSGAVLKKSIEKFHQRHRDVYGYSAENEPIEIVNSKIRVIGFLEKPKLKKIKVKKPESNLEYRKVYFEKKEKWIETPVFDRDRVNFKIEGPAVLEQYDSTTILYPGWTLEPEHYGNLILRRVT